MLKFGDPFQNILSLLIIAGFMYLIYAKWKGGDNVFKGLFHKASEIREKVNIRGGGLFGK